jgi:cellulose biosynthesis protein BcsQ
LQKPASDDIGRLLGKIDLDRKTYKIFRGGGVKPLPLPQDEPRIQANASAATQQISDDWGEPGASLRRLTAVLEREPEGPRILEQWAALDFVFGLPQPANSRASGPTGTRLPVPASSFMAAAGGVGVSTISASLARLASQEGQRVLLLDTHSPTLLPMYFGSRPPQTAISTFVSLNNLGNGARHGGVVHIGSRCEPGPKGSVWEHVESMATDCDRIFLDAADEREWDSMESFSSETVRVLVLVPDVRCLLRFQGLEAASFRPGAGSSVPPYLLLNQFDTENRLHLQIRERLEHQMKGRLIPVSIRRDPAFQYALAAGQTIIDYAPRSDAANDLRALEDWLRHEWSRRSAVEHRETVNCL